jgi:nitrogenase molybdenum-cofactor synthesis protein NifE
MSVMIGTQSGRQEEYDTINELVDDGTVIMDDTNPQNWKDLFLRKKPICWSEA